ncbi:MAG TPA: hypothetical protein VGO60_14720 [Iamia sp.]|nr:hypothetical protein [Iamia sp.]
MRRDIVRRVIVALAVLAVLVVGGLVLASRGGEDTGPTTEADLARILREDRDLTREVADCMAGQAFDRLSEDELDELREREADDELAPELRRKLEATVAPCASAGS